MKTPAGLPARKAASDIIWQVLHGRQLLDDAFENALLQHKVPFRDRALVRAIAAITLRHLGEIRLLNEKFIKKPLPKKKAWTQCVLYTATAQIMFMQVPARAATDLAVAQLNQSLKTRHMSGLANAILRRIAADGKTVLENTNPAGLNVPQWLRKIWTKDYGPEIAAEIARASLLEADTDLTVKADAPGWAERLGGVVHPAGSVRLPPGAGQIEKLEGYDDGAWWVQDAAASLPVKLLGDITGLEAADLCAAPGGKTAQLAHNGARVCAIDKSARRLDRLKDNLRRLKLEAQTICADVLDWQPDRLFDVIVLDAPCSATGTLRRHPDALWLKSSGAINNLTGLQADMLAKAQSLLKPGGTLIYCTCSLQFREGENQIASALDANPGLARKPVEASELPGLEHLINPQGDLRCLPQHGLDGFFISRLTKKDPR
ncbi:MAG TPA: methyltransferase domain-containing protein [Rhizobiales bacterium]|nr:methyltransferase domain-containing protein [Hyphomicrobiales bacterium]